MRPISDQFYSAVLLLNCMTGFRFTAEAFNVRLGDILEDVDLDDSNSITVTRGRQIISSTLPLTRINKKSGDTAAGHYSAVTVTVTAFNQTYDLDMNLNRYLFATGYKEKFFNSTGVFNNQVDLTYGHCYYVGSVRDEQNSTAAVSTCEGIVGFFAIGNMSYHIEPLSDQLNGPHRVYRDRKDAKTNHRCGVDHSSFDSLLNPLKNKRTVKRSLLWPQNFDSQTKFVELYVANDRSQFISCGSNVDAVFKRAKDIVNVVSSVYQSQSIYIVLVGMETWSYYDRITVYQDDYSSTLDQWASYRMNYINPLYNNDHGTLITNHAFERGIVGVAFVEQMCNQKSASVVADVYPLVRAIASIMAHEISHSFGQDHDDWFCTCSDPSGRCIMSSNVDAANPSLTWSECSIDQFQNGLHSCLYNIPETIYSKTSSCGNGIVESGEQCDCGNAPIQQCNSRCCNPYTCQLIAPAECAYRRCCHIDT